MHEHCSKCLSRPACVHSGCKNNSAPIDSRLSLCLLHLADTCHNAHRKWPRCRNDGLGCRKLAQSRKGGFCFACHTHAWPCSNADLGCLAHVRHPSKPTAKKRKACTSHASAPCPWENKRRKLLCSARYCPNPLDVRGETLCGPCRHDQAPCQNHCLRRAAPGNDSHCTLCRPPAQPHTGNDQGSVESAAGRLEAPSMPLPISMSPAKQASSV